MQIPETLRIQGVDYQIIASPQGIVADEFVFGLVEFEKARIRITTEDVDEQIQKITLLHEVFHIILDNFGIDTGENKEFVVDSLARGMYQILEDNPELFEN